jgi:hypothetical protein
MAGGPIKDSSGMRPWQGLGEDFRRPLRWL